jgi:hypothetical protein
MDLAQFTQMTTTESWPDLFDALAVAWRVALTVRAIHDRAEFVEVCEEVHGMTLDGVLVAKETTHEVKELLRAVARDS